MKIRPVLKKSSLSSQPEEPEKEELEALKDDEGPSGNNNNNNRRRPKPPLLRSESELMGSAAAAARAKLLEGKAGTFLCKRVRRAARALSRGKSETMGVGNIKGEICVGINGVWGSQKETSSL